MTLSGNKTSASGYVFDIQGLSVHDGPGCRTLIFLNGCTLNCHWCSNPEGISLQQSLMYSPLKCIGDGNCITSCLHNAIHLEKDKLVISREICDQCKTPTCVNDCYTNALQLSGYEISASRIYEIIQRDRQFWGRDGGITLTGGEPLLQIDFAKEILSACYDAYIHTAIETCGNIPWDNFKKVLPFIDWIFFDLKHMNNSVHKRGTGGENTLILKNAKQLSKEFEGRLIFRIPIIPNFNDSQENIEEVISFIKETGRKEINILPLHHLGREKYERLNKKYLASKYPVPTIDQLKKIEKVFRDSGIDCYVDSETPF
ncbi:MAG: glycyl-radical enzyme activating protein [Bacteroidales bacterium]|nr:glycyl-radical enzyme activating protein [Bacteroidales bacterium]